MIAARKIIGTLQRSAFCLAAAFVVGCGGANPPVLIGSGIDSTPERGRELVNGLAACGFCHGSKPEPFAVLSGGQVIQDRYGDVVAPNLTQAASGLREWSDGEIVTALRSHEGKDGRRMSSDAHIGMEWMSDSDISAIVRYIRKLPPIERQVPKREIGVMARISKGLLEARPVHKGYVAAINPSFKEQYGRYLVEHVARCQTCHNSPDTLLGDGRYLAGGRQVWRGGKSKVAPGISNSKAQGIGDWSTADVVDYLVSGTTPDGRAVNPQFCPVKFYREASRSDLEAIAVYLLSAGAVRR